MHPEVSVEKFEPFLADPQQSRKGFGIIAEMIHNHVKEFDW